MDFVLRSFAEDDLDKCLELLVDRFLYDAAHLAALRRMLSHIVASKAGLAGVVADAHTRLQVVHFAVAVFVSDERAEEYQNCKCPGISLRILEDWDSGGSPFLTREEAALANAGAGLNLVVAYYGFSDPGDKRVRFMASELASKLVLGLNFRSYTCEAFVDAKAEGEGMGLRLGYYTDEQLQAAHIPADRAPIVWSATREYAQARSNTNGLGPFFRPFLAAALRFLFCRAGDAEARPRRANRRIDREEHGHLSATKSRFRSINEKVENSGAGAEALRFSETPTAASRGAEWRRHLLNYLREHPEELQPYNADSRKAPTTAL